MEFIHELCEGKCRESISVDRDPILDKVVFEATEDARYFNIVFDASFGIYEVV